MIATCDAYTDSVMMITNIPRAESVIASDSADSTTTSTTITNTMAVRMGKCADKCLTDTMKPYVDCGSRFREPHNTGLATSNQPVQELQPDIMADSHGLC